MRQPQDATGPFVRECCADLGFPGPAMSHYQGRTNALKLRDHAVNGFALVRSQAVSVSGGRDDLNRRRCIKQPLLPR
jgi:hypothetical protein